MSRYKPFPLESPSNFKYVINGPAKVMLRPVVDFPELLGGRQFRRHHNGVRGVMVRDSLLASTAVPYERKQPKEPPLTASQVAASHVKYLRAQGWRKARILAALGVNGSFYTAVIQELTHRKVAAQKPPFLEKVAA